MSAFIPFTSDYGFKATFGNERDTTFLKKALQALIGSETPIKRVTFDKNAFEGIDQRARSGVMDISCVDEHGRQFIVEMQLEFFEEFMQRLKFYGMYKFNSLVQKGKHSFEKLRKIYCIAILGNNITTVGGYHQVVTLKNQDGETIDDQTTYILVELEKFHLTEAEVRTDLEKLIFTMKNAHQYESGDYMPPFMHEKWLEKAVSEIDRRNLSPNDLFMLEKSIAQNRMVINVRKRELKEAKKVAKEEGKAEGKAEGKEEGKAESIEG